MNQTEIFQNMTKGKWLTQKWVEVKGESCVSEITAANGVPYGTGVAKVVYEGNQNLNAEVINGTANAIISAVNNTYGKGINPESVEKMKSVLQKIQDWTETAANFPYAELKEALTPSKL